MRKKCLMLGCISAAVFSVSGCASSSTEGAPARQPPPAEVAPAAAHDSKPALANPGAPVARVGAATITREQLLQPLIEAHGLQLLLSLVQLEMVRQEAKIAKIVVSPSDVEAETARTLDRMFRDQNAEKDDYPGLLAQFLERRNMSLLEWNLLMETNATLRKVCEPKAAGAIQDEQLNTAFMQLYGEKVHVRHIAVANLQEIGEAKRRLDAGESFETVARALSRNSLTAALGGEVRPFTLNSQYPASFKDAAFALKNKGDVSNPVQADNQYHLIQLIERIPPKVIKFEEVKASIREDLEEGLIQQLSQDLRAQLSDRASKSLVIMEPTLRQQYIEEQKRREAQARGRDEVRKELEREREKSATQQAIPDLPASQPK
ncbi:MAG TPA: peptidyl-prolyl cis-trans isomerase [Tepidisphaeraceae bacterium]|nr:peptidyl-prolyl cis-trans isomerase [Tepidisphaeraceae bacterium]